SPPGKGPAAPSVWSGSRGGTGPGAACERAAVASPGRRSRAAGGLRAPGPLPQGPGAGVSRTRGRKARGCGALLSGRSRACPLCPSFRRPASHTPRRPRGWRRDGPGGTGACRDPEGARRCSEHLPGVSAQSFLHCFTLASAAFNLQVATPGGKTMDFVDVNESNARWVQDFRLKAYASPAKLESIDGARYHALLIPSCPGALSDLASSGSLARILQHFRSESSR
uniref:Glutamine amidotransferase-like class 1 domain-containing protein 1 n=1 Tax=Equus caballus TaxID=9796 RepID=A0A9L0RET4_HORSE